MLLHLDYGESAECQTRLLRLELSLSYDFYLFHSLTMYQANMKIIHVSCYLWGSLTSWEPLLLGVNPHNKVFSKMNPHLN